MTRHFAILRTVASCLLAVSLIAEWPLALALSSQHVARALEGSGVSRCVPSKDTGHAIPGKPAGTPTKTAPCPICQGIHAAQAPLPDGVAFPHPRLASRSAIAPDSAVPAAGRRVEANQPRGPPFGSIA